MPKKGLDPQISGPLRAHPLFAQVSDDGLAFLVRHATRVHYRAGRKVLREGNKANEVFVLATGGVRIYHRAPDSKEGEIVVKLFRAPAFFGEMEVLMKID
jgi:CRP-like cAMP-binding protein